MGIFFFRLKIKHIFYCELPVVLFFFFFLNCHLRMLLLIFWIIFMISTFRALNPSNFGESTECCYCEDLLPITIKEVIKLLLISKKHGVLLSLLFASCIVYLTVEIIVIISAGLVFQNNGPPNTPIILYGFIFWLGVEICIIVSILIYWIYAIVKKYYNGLLKVRASIREETSMLTTNVRLKNVTDCLSAVSDYCKILNGIKDKCYNMEGAILSDTFSAMYVKANNDLCDKLRMYVNSDQRTIITDETLEELAMELNTVTN